MFDIRICVHKAWKWRKKSLSAGDAENSWDNVTHDYSDYDNDVYTPPNSVGMDTFRHVCLPVLYSLVFLFGLIGTWDLRPIAKKIDFGSG